MTRIRKAVFPVAGLGTRFLPATKSVTKEMLPLIDRPLIQYAVDEARAAGIVEFIFITSTGQSALETYFGRNPGLERKLKDGGKTTLLNRLRCTHLEDETYSFIQQDSPRGLGHAVSLARDIVGNEPFAVILPDDVISADKPCLQQMVEAYAETGGNMVAAMEVPPEQASSYGVLDVQDDMGSIVSVKGMVEKPKAEEAPSNLAVIGRYILGPSVLTNLNKIKSGAGGEIQLTDAIAQDIGTENSVYGYRFRGQRFDCGSKAGFLQATVAFALARDDLRDDLNRYLREVIQLDKAAE